MPYGRGSATLPSMRLRRVPRPVGRMRGRIPSGQVKSWYGPDVDRIAVSLRRRRGAPRIVGLFVGLLAGLAASANQPIDVATTTESSELAQLGQPQPALKGLSEHDALLFALPTTHDHIGRVVVPVMVNGRGPFRFIVDTGANHSTISPGLAQALGLEPTAPSVLLDGITGTAQVSFVSIDKLQAGDLTIDETALPVVSAPVMAGADGILGAAGLAEQSLLVDFQRNRVVISRRIEGALRAEATKIHALQVSHGLITLDALVGGVTVRAVVDTGSERTLGNLALRDALHMHPTRGGPVAQLTSVYGATKEIERGEIRAAPPIAIAGLRITDLAIVYGRFHIFKVWDMEAKPAIIIGMDVLGTVDSLGIDFKNQDVYLTSSRVNGAPNVRPAGALGDSMQKR